MSALWQAETRAIVNERVTWPGIACQLGCIWVLLQASHAHPDREMLPLPQDE
jgi:hypothetical protein